MTRVQKSPTFTPFAIAMPINKTFLGSKIIGPNDGLQSKLQGVEFDLLLEEFSPLHFLNIQNQMNKLGSGTKGFIDQILDLKKWALYDYIQDNIFPSQSSLKSFLFKMSIYGRIIGVDIVRHMQPPRGFGRNTVDV